jgi:hypothetical protein
MVRTMSPVRRMAAGSISLAALLSVTAPAVANAAIQQVQSTRTQGSRVLDDEEDRSHPCDDAAAFDATQGDVQDPVERQPSPPAARQPSAPRTGPRDRPFVAVLMAVPLVTYAGATGSRGSEMLTPADRFATSQLIGAGYVVNPNFRFGVMGIFNEVLTGQPPAVDAWQFGGIAPIAIGTFEHVIIGGGPIIGYRSGGKRQSDVGAVVLSGASIPLRKGLALNIAAPITTLFVRRVTVSVGVAVGVAKVF